MFQSPKRQSEYRPVAFDRPNSGIGVPILLGAVVIAVAILLSTLVTALGNRFVGMESPAEDTMWLIDRLSGSVYRCRAPERGKASCEPEMITGSVGERTKP